MIANPNLRKILNSLLFLPVYILWLYLGCVDSSAQEIRQEPVDSIEGQQLEELIVKKKRNKYSKKNNPAVDLIRKVRKDRDKSDPAKSDAYIYEKYNKTLLGTTDVAFNFGKKSGLPKKLAFMEQLIDTTPWTGKRM